MRLTIQQAGSANVTNNRATPAVSAWPTASATATGIIDADRRFGCAPGSFSWTNPATACGRTQEGVTLTPTDAADYNTRGGSAERERRIPPWLMTLTVNSAAPSSGIMISPVSPADNKSGKLGNNAVHVLLPFRHASNSECSTLLQQLFFRLLEPDGVSQCSGLAESLM